MFSSQNSQVSSAANYIEDVFSTYLYTGNATTGQSINNGIDLSTKGGLLWCKNRTTAATLHYLFDTARGFSYSSAESLNTASTAAAQSNGTNYAKPETNGFSFGTGAGSTSPNKNGDNFASWTFRKQPKFFDVVTYTGDGATYSGGGRQITHNLQCRPGFILIKRTDSTGNWIVGAYDGSTNYYVSDSSTPSYNFFLNSTTPGGTFSASDVTPSVNTTINITTLDYPTNSANINGASYVMYVWAAGGAGGFGLTGTDNVISCGSFTGDGTGAATVNLGYEPQYVLIKRTDAASDWEILDTMRGLYNYSPYTGSGVAANRLLANTSGAEQANYTGCGISATGFAYGNGYPSSTYIYIAIRRGPMKVPTDATTVFKPISSSASTGTTQTTNFPVDMQWLRTRDSADAFYVIDRLRGISTTPTTASSRTIYTTSTSAEGGTNTSNGWNNSGFNIPSQQTGASTIYESFRRAPSFFDEVCYTGTGSTQFVNHNLTVAPELAIVKLRNGTNNWRVWSKYPTGQTAGYCVNLNTTAAWSNTGLGLWGPDSSFNANGFTASSIKVGTDASVNGSGSTYVAYLFATCAGVSKVGSYTGTGTLTTIDCGFTGGARFVLIKRTDSSGNWYVWDTARGMTSGTDPSLYINDYVVEVNANSVYTISTGFQLLASPSADVNTNGGTYIYLAIA